MNSWTYTYMRAKYRIYFLFKSVKNKNFYFLIQKKLEMKNVFFSSKYTLKTEIVHIKI